ncbi:MAG: glycine cleavage system protein GcvH [Candidatus Omnitrophica bacterium]|nr:glycine cleavage system protein GcvH [Candidatus Omnitrophota bacterium]
MQIPEKLLYTKEHEWARIEGKTATIGITDFAQGSLGDITFADLPKVGSILEQFKQCATVESVKAASDVYAPVSGKVIKINTELASHPELVNQSPYDKGYFAVVEMTSPVEATRLIPASEYKEYVESLAK